MPTKKNIEMQPCTLGFIVFALTIAVLPGLPVPDF